MIPYTVNIKLAARTLTGTVNLQNKTAVDWGWQGLIAQGCHSSILIIDPKTAQTIQVLERHKANVVKVKWSRENYHHSLSAPYSLRLASADAAGKIIIWDVVSGTAHCEIQEHTKPIQDMDWLWAQDASRDLLLAIHPPNYMVLWNADTGAKLWKKSYAENILSFSFDPFDPSNLALLTSEGIVFITDFSHSKPPGSGGKKVYIASPHASPAHNKPAAPTGAKKALNKVKVLITNEKPRHAGSVRERGSVPQRGPSHARGDGGCCHGYRGGEAPSVPFFSRRTAASGRCEIGFVRESLGVVESAESSALSQGSLTPGLRAFPGRGVTIENITGDVKLHSLCPCEQRRGGDPDCLQLTCPPNATTCCCCPEILILDLELSQTVGVVAIERSGVPFIQVVPCAQRDALFYPEQSVQELVYDLRSQCDAIRVTKTVRPYRVVICPVNENSAALVVSDGRVMMWELKAHVVKTPVNLSSGLSPLYSPGSFGSTPLGQNQKKILDLSLNTMIGQSLVSGSEPASLPAPQEVQLKFLLTGLLSGLPLPPSPCECAPLTTKNINHYQPLLAVGTSTGSVLVYNLTGGLLHKELSVHSCEVRGIEWISLTSFLSFATSAPNNLGLVRNELQHVDLPTGREAALLKREYGRLDLLHPLCLTGRWLLALMRFPLGEGRETEREEVNSARGRSERSAVWGRRLQ
ncbi:hypothetical protein COCON_G00226280 [Conger conger]|uniref:WDR11 first beta-propeller domain-containing protein n=1 Tax=Conger conger TaxID=82655 RepID=A0A9Q1CX12_CONCO|nr:hypothetical protein COCON_G00226280 [Conger conger]